MSDYTPLVAPLSTLLGVALTILAQALVASGNRKFDLEKEQLKIARDNTEKRLWLIRERLEKMHLLLSEIGREFSLTFLTVDWEAKLSRADHHAKYRSLCAKLEEAQMISDLYAQGISYELSELAGEMSCYWGYFGQVLYLEQQGKKVDHDTPAYQKAFDYSQAIPKRVAAIQKEIRLMSSNIMNHAGYREP